MSNPNSTPSFSSRLAYKDLRGAVAWLEKAFGFKKTLLCTIPDGSVVHAEMSFGSGAIHVSGEWENVKTPGSIGGANSQNICVHVASGIDELFERARAAGAVIVQAPQDQFHGDRTFRVIVPEGHVWGCSQKLREMTVEELAAGVPGMKVERFG